MLKTSLLLKATLLLKTRLLLTSRLVVEILLDPRLTSLVPRIPPRRRRRRRRLDLVYLDNLLGWLGSVLGSLLTSTTPGES